MAEWRIEDGIGETRAILVEREHILEIAIEPDDGALRVGARLAARLIARPDAGGRARVGLDGGGEALLQPVPVGLAEGARLTVEVTREAYVEPGGQPKPVRVRAAPDDAPSGGDLRTRIGASGLPVRRVCASDPDGLDAFGWTEAMEEATTGLVARPEAMLRISPTPAMTLIDVDGNGAPAALAIAGARLAGEVIRRFGIVGSIGIDLPTLTAKADRLAVAAALDGVLPQPFERTAVNGFGFLQIVRRRARPSLIERIAADRPLAAARALLRTAERAQGRGALTLSAPAAVIARLEAHPAWIDDLQRRTGAAVTLRADPSLAISGGHVHYTHS